MPWLFLLFTVVPLTELWLLAALGRVLGFLPTVALVLLTGAVGAALARAEGFRVIREWQDAMRAGRVPADGVLGGLLVLVGGVLLITPGVLTDVVGLGLLVPPVRRWLAATIGAAVQRRIDDGRVTVVRVDGVGGPFGPPPGREPFDAPRRPPRVIDVPGRVVDEGPSDER